MSRVWKIVGVLLLAALGTDVGAEGRRLAVAVVMTNDTTDNAIKVYDVRTQTLLQTLATHGQGGAGGNARGVRAHDGDLVAVVNNGSNTVAVFRRDGRGFRFQQLVTTTSAPVSIDFGNEHMYVAGATTVDSFRIRQGGVERLDGTVNLQLAGGGVPPSGSTAQVGVVSDSQLLVTLKTDPTPGTVDVVALEHGAISGAAPAAVTAPDGTLTPFGFSIYPDGTALITLAHSNQDGLFRDGAFTAVVAAGQSAPCWTSRAGKYVFTANAASRTISRIVGTGNNVFVDGGVAATVLTGGPADLDTDGGTLGVVDHAAGQSHLSLFSYNEFGELTPAGTVITIGVPNANGVAIVSGRSDDN
jgi:hypothetical protein